MELNFVAAAVSTGKRRSQIMNRVQGRALEWVGLSGVLRAQRKDVSRLKGGEGRARGRMWWLSLPSLHCQPGPPPLQSLSHLDFHACHSFRPEGPFSYCTRQSLSFRSWLNSLFFLEVFPDALVWVTPCSIFPWNSNLPHPIPLITSSGN